MLHEAHLLRQDHLLHILLPTFYYDDVYVSLLQNLKTRSEIEALAEEGNEKQLWQLLERRMVFGTAGKYVLEDNLSYAAYESHNTMQSFCHVSKSHTST